MGATLLRPRSHQREESVGLERVASGRTTRPPARALALGEGLLGGLDDRVPVGAEMTRSLTAVRLIGGGHYEYPRSIRRWGKTENRRRVDLEQQVELPLRESLRAKRPGRIRERVGVIPALTWPLSLETNARSTPAARMPAT